jgi:membrane-bound ClpP family serine protease
MSPLVWAILILLLGLALMVLEMFIPSAGLLALLSLTAFVTSVGMVFVYQGTTWGALYLTGLCLTLPFLAVALVRWWPRTPIGRRILNLPPPDVSGGSPLPADRDNRFAHLVGEHGLAKTKMLPSGAIVVAGRTDDAVSEGVPIEPGQPVRVIDVRGNRIVVRPASELPHAVSRPDAAPDQQLDAVVPDPFDESLS